MKYLILFNESNGITQTNTTSYTASKLIDKLKRLNYINGSLTPEHGDKGGLYTGIKTGYNIRIILSGDKSALDRTFDINVSNKDALSTKGFNSFDEDSDAVDISFKDIGVIIKDLNK
jgi:hypothetical protein